ncbi:MAG: HAMP domain-containing sensor histidine kinase [Azospirillaceae bacterium]
MKDDFLSSVSHELRTPMTSIRSFAEILTDGPPPDPEEARRFLEIIHHESQRLTRLLDDILDLSRLEASEVNWDLKPLDCRDVVEAAMETMRGLAEQQGVVLENRLARAPVLVMAEGDRLKQVFVNLISNAINHNSGTDQRAWVSLARTERPDEVVIEVGDNGPGIPQAERDVIFSKFSRSWTQRPDRAAGTGLGLAISRQIMAHMGGNLRLGETGETGTIFAVVLRRAERQAEPLAAQVAE